MLGTAADLQKALRKEHPDAAAGQCNVHRGLLARDAELVEAYVTCPFVAQQIDRPNALGGRCRSRFGRRRGGRSRGAGGEGDGEERNGEGSQRHGSSLRERSDSEGYARYEGSVSFRLSFRPRESDWGSPPPS